jgi:hypothetical protein
MYVYGPSVHSRTVDLLQLSHLCAEHVIFVLRSPGLIHDALDAKHILHRGGGCQLGWVTTLRHTDIYSSMFRMFFLHYFKKAVCLALIFP